MEPRITQVESFTVVGIPLEEAGRDPGLIMHGWIALAVRKQEIPHQVRPHILYGVWYHKLEGARYLVGVEVEKADDVPPGMVALTIPAGLYAVVEHRGSMGRIGEAFGRFREWIGPSEYDGLPTPTWERYDTTQPIDGQILLQIHEPVRRLGSGE